MQRAQNHEWCDCKRTRPLRDPLMQEARGKREGGGASSDNNIVSGHETEQKLQEIMKTGKPTCYSPWDAKDSGTQPSYSATLFLASEISRCPDCGILDVAVSGCNCECLKERHLGPSV